MADKKEKKKVKAQIKLEPKVEEIKEPVIPDGAKTYVVGGWSAIKSIRSALAITDPTAGDKVAINAGTYEELVEVDKDGLAMKGTASCEAVTFCRGVRASAMNCSLMNVTIHGELEVEKGNITVTDCTILHGKHGVVIHAIASPTIQNNLMQQQKVAAVYAFPKSRGLVEGNEMIGTGTETSVGIFADQSNTTFKGNKIYGQTTGVTIQGECAGLVLQGNSISKIGGIGLHFTKGAKSLCKGNTVESCKYYGLVLEKSASPRIEKNVISACTVSIRVGCKPVLRQNDFTGRVIDENSIENTRLQPTY